MPEKVVQLMSTLHDTEWEDAKISSEAAHRAARVAHDVVQYIQRIIPGAPLELIDEITKELQEAMRAAQQAAQAAKQSDYAAQNAMSAIGRTRMYRMHAMQDAQIQHLTAAHCAQRAQLASRQIYHIVSKK